MDKPTPGNSARLQIVGVGIGLLVISILLLFSWTNLADPDSFYHFAHGQLYSHNQFRPGFEFLAFSSVNEYKADLWFGLHVFAALFSGISDPLIGIRCSIVAWLSISLFIAYFAVFRLNVRGAWVVPLLILLSGPVETGRLMALRPQSMSMALFLLIFSFAVSHPRMHFALIAGFMLGFCHQTVSWLLLPLSAITLTLDCYLHGFKNGWRTTSFAILGCVLSWVLRPSPVAALSLMKIQIVELGRAKAAGIPLPFGAEVYKFTVPELISHFSLFASLWLLSLFALVLVYKKMKADASKPCSITLFAIGSGVASLCFYVLLMTESTRGLEYWVAFASSTCVCAAHLFLPALHSPRAALHKLLGSGVALVLAIVSLPSLHQFMVKEAIMPERLKRVAVELGETGRKGDIVWCPYWETFPEILFWNKEIRQIQGMDPIFLYAQDQERFWQIFYLRNRLSAAVTYSGPPSNRGIEKPTLRVLTEDFSASFAYVLKESTPELAAYLKSAPGVQVLLDDGAVLLVKLPD